VFQWGWGAGLIGATAGTPFLAYLPIMLLAVLFGLSMDYQVFLVSRMREEWVATGDNTKAVTLGLSETGKVITAAALIMVFVFLAFVTAGEPALKMSGAGMAVAVFLDAFVVRSLLVPALMQVLGRWNWWLPRWLDRIVPHVNV
jgi:RND superfamily putative drug exporter